MCGSVLSGQEEQGRLFWPWRGTANSVLIRGRQVGKKEQRCSLVKLGLRGSDKIGIGEKVAPGQEGDGSSAPLTSGPVNLRICDANRGTQTLDHLITLMRIELCKVEYSKEFSS